MFELPLEDIEPSILEPRFLILYSLPKTGKTSSLIKLPNSLHIDLESSGGFFKGKTLDVNKIAEKEQKHQITVIKEIADKIKDANSAAGKPVYDFITLDSATILEEHAALLATKNYKNSVIGKSFTGKNVVTDLPSGAGQ